MWITKGSHTILHVRRSNLDLSVDRSSGDIRHCSCATAPTQTVRVVPRQKHIHDTRTPKPNNFLKPQDSTVEPTVWVCVLRHIYSTVQYILCNTCCFKELSLQKGQLAPWQANTSYHVMSHKLYSVQYSTVFNFGKNWKNATVKNNLFLILSSMDERYSRNGWFGTSRTSGTKSQFNVINW